MNKTSFSIMDGGFVYGKVVGIAHVNTDQVGATIRVFHLGMEEYILVGEKITEPICGVDILGNITIYLITSLEITGEVGMKEGIGKIITTGALKERTGRSTKEQGHSTKGLELNSFQELELIQRLNSFIQEHQLNSFQELKVERKQERLTKVLGLPNMAR
jgi:S-adenosylmethionine hydrolase